MKESDHKLPPLRPNMGITNYPWTVSIREISEAIKRFKKGEKPTEEQKAEWPGLSKHWEDLA